MGAKLRTVLAKITQVAQARGWTAPDPRLAAQVQALEQRVAHLEQALGVPPVPQNPPPVTP